MAGKQKRDRAQIMMRSETRDLAAKLRDELVERSGARVTLADTVDRALKCLADAHERGAWLSSKEAAPILEQRHRDILASVIAQFVAAELPDKRLKGVAFKGNEMVVIFADGAERPLYAPLTPTDQGPMQH